MLRRITLGVLLFAMGAYTSISFLVDDWEGSRCRRLEVQTYDRLPFGEAFTEAWHDLFTRMAQGEAPLAAPVHTAFIFAVLAVLIAPRRLITIAAFLTISLPFALTVYEKIMLGLAPYCDDVHGEKALLVANIQLLFVLPIGFVLSLAAAFAARKPVS